MLLMALGFLSQAELSLALGTFVPLSQRLSAGRSDPMTVGLQDGRILIAGGIASSSKYGPYFSTAVDTFDPGTGGFDSLGVLKEPRARTTPIVLSDGKILFFGGDRYLKVTAETLDPKTGVSEPFAVPPEVPLGASVAPLPDGKILIFGGFTIEADNSYEYLKDALILDPATREVTRIPDMPFPLHEPVALPLPDGKVMILGGANSPYRQVNQVFIYDPAYPSFKLGEPLLLPRVGAAVVVLEDGRVLIAGGAVTEHNGYWTSIPQAEVYDPDSGNSTLTGDPTLTRRDASAVRLSDGRVLISGGYGQVRYGPKLPEQKTMASEIYDPSNGQFTPTGDLYRPRMGAALIALPGGRALAAGGVRNFELYDSQGLDSAESFNPEGEVAKVKRIVIKPRVRTVRIGKWFRFKVRIENTGKGIARRTKVCTTLVTWRFFDDYRCPTVTNIPPGQSRTAIFAAKFENPKTSFAEHPIVRGKTKRMEIYAIGQDVNVYSTVRVKIR